MFIVRRAYTLSRAPEERNISLLRSSGAQEQFNRRSYKHLAPTEPRKWTVDACIDRPAKFKDNVSGLDQSILKFVGHS